MIYLLIKAKSGLHAGATWRLDRNVFHLGASSRADVFLCDPGVPDMLITFRKTGRKFRVEGLNQEARIRSTDNRDVSDVLLPSQTAILDFRQIQLEIQVLTSSFSIANAFGDRFSYMFHDFLRMLRNLGLRAFFGFLFLISLSITGLVLFFGTAGVVKSEASILKKPGPQSSLLSAPVKSPTMDQQMAKNLAQEMRDFARRVNAQNFEVEVQNTRVDIHAVLSRLQAVQFEKELRRHSSDYGENVHINATLEFTEEQKIIDSLEVERLVLGTRPALILRDGSLLYVGGDYQGMNVLSISPRKVVLQGQTAYEVSL